MKQYDPFRARKHGRGVWWCVWMNLVLLLPWIFRPLRHWLDRLVLQKTFAIGQTTVFVKQQFGGRWI